MKRDGIWGSIFRITRQEEPLSNILRTIPLFADLTPKELGILGDAVHRRTYQAGETVFVETEPGAGMYVIQSGHVGIVMKAESETPRVLAELSPGDFFGEMALLGDMTRSATAVARQRSELIGFFHPDLLEIIKFHPHIGAKIALGLSRTLAERLRYTNDQLRETWDVREPHAAAGT
jgi:CRP/FNR family transcriptional regulator, cyclic AMP receptor protein